MNRALAGESEIACLLRGCLHALRVFQIEIRHIDDVEPGRGGGVHDPRSCVEQRLPGIAAAKLGCHVDAAKEQCVQARAAVRDLVSGLQPLVGLDDNVQARVVTALGQEIVEPDHLVRRPYLRQHERRRRRVARQHRLHVV